MNRYVGVVIDNKIIIRSLEELCDAAKIRSINLDDAHAKKLDIFYYSEDCIPLLIRLKYRAKLIKQKGFKYPEHVTDYLVCRNFTKTFDGEKYYKVLPKCLVSMGDRRNYLTLIEYKILYCMDYANLRGSKKIPRKIRKKFKIKTLDLPKVRYEYAAMRDGAFTYAVDYAEYIPEEERIPIDSIEWKTPYGVRTAFVEHYGNIKIPLSIRIKCGGIKRVYGYTDFKKYKCLVQRNVGNIIEVYTKDEIKKNKLYKEWGTTVMEVAEAVLFAVRHGKTFVVDSENNEILDFLNKQNVSVETY